MINSLKRGVRKWANKTIIEDEMEEVESISNMNLVLQNKSNDGFVP